MVKKFKWNENLELEKEDLKSGLIRTCREMLRDMVQWYRRFKMISCKHPTMLVTKGV